MMWRPRSLRSLTAAFLLLFLVAVAATGYATFHATKQTIRILVDKRLDALSGEVLTDTRRGDAAAILDHLAMLSRQRATGDIGFALTDAGGRWLGGNVRPARPLPPGFSALTAQNGIAGLSTGRALVRDAGGGLSFATIAETEPIDDFGPARVRLYAIGFGSIIVIVLTGTALFGTIVSRRIGEVRATAQAIIDGDMRRRVPVDPGGGAFADQAAAFNRMLDRIAQLMAAITNVSNDIAHDMRTPLARLRSRLALLDARADTAAVRDELAAATADCDALLAMFTATLRIAEVEGGDRRAGFAPLDLAALAGDFGEMMAPVAAEAGHPLIIERRAAAAAIVGDRQLLSQALLNLVENALRHTPPGTPVTLSVAVAGGDAVLAVRDAGAGIPPAEHALALRRFGRLERSRTTPGHGLGLPLAAAVARLHRGTLTLEDAAPGLRVVLRLPLA